MQEKNKKFLSSILDLYKPKDSAVSDNVMPNTLTGTSKLGNYNGVSTHECSSPIYRQVCPGIGKYKQDTTAKIAESHRRRRFS